MFCPPTYERSEMDAASYLKRDEILRGQPVGFLAAENEIRV